VRTWVRLIWRRLSLIEQFAVVALALVCGLFVSAGGGGGGVPQAAVAVVVLAMLVILPAMVGRASEEIAASRRAARGWNGEKARLLEQNADLRRQIDESHRRSVEINDMVLRRVGVELHDGPAQLISLALLRLDCLRPQGTEPDGGASLDDFERIRCALQEALAEIRCMATGLTLPDLSCVSPGDALRLAVRNHERRTATSVTWEVEGLPHQVPAPIKSCLYRFAQEALNNAYRHAGGRGQTVRGKCRGRTIEVEVADAGPGFEPDNGIVGSHLGLLGMHERIASLGGTLEINSRPGTGTRLTTRFELADHGGSQG
jgi:signal transduction histidine kinase